MMKKKIFAIAIVLGAFTGSAAYAQNNVTGEIVTENNVTVAIDNDNVSANKTEKVGRPGKGKKAKEGKACCKEDNKSCKQQCKDGKQCSKDGKKCKKGERDIRRGDMKCGKAEKCDRKPGKCDMFEGIDLTAEQQSKISALKSEAKAEKMKVKKERAAKDSVAREKAMNEIDKKIEKILTPEQMTQFKANRAKAQESRKARMEKRGPRNPEFGMKEARFKKGVAHKGHRKMSPKSAKREQVSLKTSNS